jgi:dipeptidyl aminopeptidase/acylaminoacyl peptidase
LFVVDTATGSAKQLTSGREQNESEPQWSPDGKGIVYVSQRTDVDLLGGAGLFVISADGGTPARISEIATSIHSPRWSPDGARLAFIGSTDATNIPKVWIAASSGGKATLVSNEVTFAAEVEWAGEKELVYSAAVRGAHPIFRIDLASGKSTALTTRWSVRNMDLHERSGRIAFAASDDTHPAEVMIVDLHSGTSKSLANLNSKLAQVDVQPVESFTYPGAGGLPIEGFLTKPAGWQAGKSYPMVLMIHGGPNGMWGYQWNHEIQTFAAHGWAVLGLNPRGSSGYGEAFQRAVFKEWGGKAYQDILAGVDATIARYPWIDRARLGVTGHSYGGFMTDWIVGHTDLFKAACTLAGISDFISVEGIRDGYYGHTRDFGPHLFEDFEVYLNTSPIRYAKNAKTPTLILHGELDQRVPLSQGEEFFRALQHFNVPSEMVVLPREGHSLRSEPRHAVGLLKWQIYWFERWMEGNTNAVKPD